GPPSPRARPQVLRARHRDGPRAVRQGTERAQRAHLVQARLAPASAYAEAEHVGPVVVPGRVEALALLMQAHRVELGVQDPLLVPERPGQVGAVGAEDRGAAVAEKVVALGDPDVVGVARGALEDAAADEKR